MVTGRFAARVMAALFPAYRTVAFLAVADPMVAEARRPLAHAISRGVYSAVFILWGNSIPHETLPEFSMKEIAGRLARVIGVRF